MQSSLTEAKESKQHYIENKIQLFTTPAFTLAVFQDVMISKQITCMLITKFGVQTQFGGNLTLGPGKVATCQIVTKTAKLAG